MDDYISEDTINNGIEVLQDKNKVREMVDHNYNIGEYELDGNKKNDKED